MDIEKKGLTAAGLAGGSPRRGRVEHDYYATPENCTESLLEKIDFKGTILEPSCGEGHISKVLKSHGFEVYSNDIVDRGYGDMHKDFLEETFDTYDNVITNPPFKLSKAFILKSLDVSRDKVAMFCKIQFLEGVSRYEMFKTTPLKHVLVFVKRQNPYRNGSMYNEHGKKWQSTMCFAWFVWEKGYEGQPMIDWISD